MMSFNARIKSAMLVVAMLATSYAAAFSASAFIPNSPQKAAGYFLVACYIQLQAKGTNYDYQLSDWKEDLREILEDYGIFDIELYQKLVKLFDKYIVGRKLSIYKKSIRSKSEDGSSIITKEDNYVKSTPFGLMGLFDAYVIGMLEGIGKIATNWDSANKLFAKFDNCTIVNVTVNK